mmetsp:Transcript_24008/g.77075  ORF Transcript_24008/g.77075 Transcript_24008/m.77075 type:complete len:275 (+) Transcript_24008:416-1240(+)
MRGVGRRLLHLAGGVLLQKKREADALAEPCVPVQLVRVPDGGVEGVARLPADELEEVAREGAVEGGGKEAAHDRLEVVLGLGVVCESARDKDVGQRRAGGEDGAVGEDGGDARAERVLVQRSVDGGGVDVRDDDAGDARAQRLAKHLCADVLQEAAARALVEWHHLGQEVDDGVDEAAVEEVLDVAGEGEQRGERRHRRGVGKYGAGVGILARPPLAAGARAAAAKSGRAVEGADTRGDRFGCVPERRCTAGAVVHRQLGRLRYVLLANAHLLV